MVKCNASECRYHGRNDKCLLRAIRLTAHIVKSRDGKTNKYMKCLGYEEDPNHIESELDTFDYLKSILETE